MLVSSFWLNVQWVPCFRPIVARVVFSVPTPNRVQKNILLVHFELKLFGHFKAIATFVKVRLCYQMLLCAGIELVRDVAGMKGLGNMTNVKSWSYWNFLQYLQSFTWHCVLFSFIFNACVFVINTIRIHYSCVKIANSFYDAVANKQS